MSVWILILLSSGGGILIAHLLKYTGYKNLNTLRVLTVNYLVAATIAFISSGDQLPGSDLSTLLPVILFAAAVGIVFIANFFVYSKSADHNGVGISVAAMRISLVIPVLVSVLWYEEYPETGEWIGIVLVFVTLYLLLPDKKIPRRRHRHMAWLPLLLFFLAGAGDASLKIFETDYSEILGRDQFLGIVFLMSFLTGVIAVTLQFSWKISRIEAATGFAIGITNFCSTVFLIQALSLMNGAIVYSAVNLVTVIGATILGIWKWGDRLTCSQWAGLGLTLVTLLLLI